MRTKLIALLVAGVLAGIWSQGARAVPADMAGVNAAATETSAVVKAHYHHRHGFVKCYYELVIGPYVCHRFHRW